ncbi:variant erythrocyte surface antigen-1 family protein [Babesia caballi]|uniref:Variant erythrocyte surface antigen-1 family protein n=1 Tax=Babesia caballi TaxID=5871 RepID=A0AAV4LQ81_BABCB|nr:variant erythrocyte surface antigen-1 family protein [Babesia caballi]
MTTGQKSSLTEPPKNLKEAIDWVIQIKGHAQDLAKELDALLKNDGSEVALKVLDKYRLVSESVIQGLEEANSSIHLAKDRFYFTYTALDNLSQGLKPFVTGSQANINPDDVEQVKEWVSSVDKSDLQKRIEALATGIENLKNGIVQTSSYTSVYNSATPLSSLIPSAKTDCAAILLGIMPVVYIGITYLYWQCEGTGGWAQEKFDSSGSGQGSLKQYMEAFGYTEKYLNDSKRGQEIVTKLKDAFSNELKNAYGPSQTHYFNFLKTLQQTALISQPPLSSSPLTSLYLLSYYYITYPLHKAQSSSPATPSFLGYSGLVALAGGAYGFNLGGLGTVMSALLA